MPAQKKSLAPELKLLGKTAVKYPAKPSSTTLETFPNRNTKRDYWITFDCPEFTSMCPVTGQPDFAKLSISYIPAERCIETKSLKFYLASFRNTRSFNEEVINRILDDLVKASSPQTMVIHGEFASRGGISVTVEAEYPELLLSDLK